MSELSRRRILQLGSGVGVAGVAGCVTELGAGSTPESPESERQSCDEYVYRATDSESNGELPWHLSIRNIPLATYSVSITILDISTGTPEEVLSCTATSDTQSELVFDLSATTPYRIQVTLNRPGNPEQAATTVSGWNRVTGSKEALLVSVEDGAFGIQRVHYDPGMTTTEESG